MQASLFWRTWPQSYQRLFYLSLFLLLGALVIWGFFAWKGVDSVLHWDILSELSEIPFAFDQFEANGSRFTIDATAYTLTEQFVASPMSVIHPGIDWLCLLFILAGTVLTLAAVTTLPRLWYFAAMTIFIVLVSSLQLDTLYNRTDRLITIAVVGVFSGLSFYFHAFRTHSSVMLRIAVMALATIITVGLLTELGDITAADFLTYGYPAGMLLVLVFSFWVSFEIMIGLVWLATNQPGKNSLPNFAFLSLFYVANLALTQLHNTKMIDWNMLYLSPFIYFGVSTILGIWGMKKREDQGVSSWSFAPQGLVLYFGLATISVAVLAYVNSTANDPAVEALEDGISYTHLTAGILFFFYVFFNFGTLMRDGKPIHRVLFKPPYFSRLHVRGLSVILTVLLLYNNNFFPIEQAAAGYFNGLGDQAAARKDYRLAETFYRQGITFEFQNHKSNYGLASLAWVQGDFAAAARYFRLALTKQPSAYAYAGLTRSLMNEDLAFDAFFAAREGQQRFPDSGELLSNLGYLHAKASGSDSAQYFYEKAITLSGESGIPLANLQSLLLKKGDVKTAESISKKYSSTYASAQANDAAIALLNGQTIKAKLILTPDSVLTLSQMALLANTTLARIKLKETPPLSEKELFSLEQREENTSYYNDLQYIRALQSYYEGQTLDALDLLTSRAMGDTTASGDRWRKPLAAFLNRAIGTTPPASELDDVARHPLNIAVLQRYVAESNRKKEPQKAYDALFNALRYREDSPELIQMYILQSLDMGLAPYAEDKLNLLKTNNPEAYEAFLPVYQEKRALIEKDREAFQ